MTEVKERAVALRKSLKEETLRRVASFSDAESFFLRGLLLDDPADASKATKEGTQDDIVAHQLSDEILFSVPPASLLSVHKTELPSHHKPARRRSNLALWKAHEIGVPSKALIKQAELKASEADPLSEGRDVSRNGAGGRETADEREKSGERDVDDVASDAEVRPEATSDVSEASSWDEDDHRDNYNTWEILNDEYAEDFGFDFTGRGISLDSIISDDESAGNAFAILGTSAEDKSVQPHVLSPPLMDALANFLPDEVAGENFWLRYSLVRDGVSLETMRNYVRGAQHTLIAIETPKGEVFGSFTSSPWRVNMGYFGSQPSFVWRMRHNRRSKCSSLFEQAQLESEIDVFMCTNKKELVQVCRHDQLAVGGDEYREDNDYSIDLDQSGFAFSLESDLLVGTTSPCRSFTSPALVGKGGKTEVFAVAGLEVWSFTSCFDVQSAQKLEMTKFFIEESLRSARTGSTASSRSGFSSNDLLSDRFYQRVGQDYASQERRDRWQYTNMMNPVGNINGGLQSSPRFI